MTSVFIVFTSFLSFQTAKRPGSIWRLHSKTTSAGRQGMKKASIFVLDADRIHPKTKA
ncbi:hypothetical protein ACNQFG_10420 [Faecalibacterium prausnitzii]|uniref:hypothetical protein n=1 Tax=Faecalibacterium prausnitzii TaxID=853 RepID=UPI003C2CD0CC